MATATEIKAFRKLVGKHPAWPRALCFGDSWLQYPPHPTDLDIVWRMALCGIGFGLFQSPNNHTIVTAAPAHRSGGAAGMLGTARLTGQSLGALLVGALYGLWAAQPAQVPAMALGLAAALALAGGATSLLRVRVQAQG